MGRGWAPSIARPWVPLLPFLRYLAGSKSVSACPYDPDTITTTALEATASSSGKNQTVMDEETVSAECYKYRMP